MDTYEDRVTPATAAPGATRWLRPAGLKVLGRVEGSGLTSETYLVRRGDGQTAQLSALLHLVLTEVSPRRTIEQTAAAVSAAYGRELDPEGLLHVLETKLEPLGLVQREHPEHDAQTQRARPLLALALKGTLLPARAVQAISRPIAFVHRLPVVIAAVVAAIVLDVIIIRTANAGAALEDLLATPAQLLLLWVILTVGGLVHELGHATACVYGGGRPGTIGFGVYLLFPAFYTDVTDSYRLPRPARIRVDLGGLYFNVLCLITLALLYRSTGNGVWLLALVIMHLEMAQQLVPAVRLDGYFVLADLAGVPDLFARVGPVLRSLRPGAPTDPRVAELRPRARRVVIAWVLLVTPTLLLGAGWLLWSLPFIISTNVTAIQAQVTQLQLASATGSVILAILAILSILLLVVPLLGVGVLLYRLIRGLWGLIVRLVQGPGHRGGTANATRNLTSASKDTSMTASTNLGPNSTTPSDPEPHLHMAAPQLQVPAPDLAPAPLAQGPTPDPSPAAQPPASDPAPTPSRQPVAEPSFLPTAEDFRDDLILPSAKVTARSGWRAKVNRLSGHTMSLGPGPEERRRLEIEARLRAPIAGSRRVVVMSRKGGVGKTTMSFAIGSTFASLRGDRVIAVDANPDAGNLSHRVSPPNGRTITDILRDMDQIDSYSVLRDYTSQADESRLEVLASNDDPRIGMALDRDDYHRLIGLLDRFYNLIVLDTGTGILDSANQGLLSEADQVVLVLRQGIDGGRAAALTLDWLDEHDYEDLVRGAVVVINAVRPGVGAPLDPIVDHFSRRCAQVVCVPWDPALEVGGQTRLSALRDDTLAGLVDVAAAVADGFTPERTAR